MLRNKLTDLLIAKTFSTVEKEKYWYFWTREYINFNDRKYYTSEQFERNIDVIFYVINQIELKGYNFHIFSDEIRIMVKLESYNYVPPVEFTIDKKDFENKVYNNLRAIYMAIEKFYYEYGKYINNR